MRGQISRARRRGEAKVTKIRDMIRSQADKHVKAPLVRYLYECNALSCLPWICRIRARSHRSI